MSAISAANVARLTSASPEQMRAAVEAVLTLANEIESAERESYLASSRIIARRFRLEVEGALR